MPCLGMLEAASTVNLKSDRFYSRRDFLLAGVLSQLSGQSLNGCSFGSLAPPGISGES